MSVRLIFKFLFLKMKVIFFSAVWCPACIIMQSRWKKIEAELPWLVTEQLDYDNNKEAVGRYGIGKDIPVFIFLDEAGDEFARKQGEIDRKDLIKFLEENKDK